MEINGVQFEFDPTDYKSVARIEAAEKAFRSEAKRIECSQFSSAAEVYEAHVNAVRSFFLQVTEVDVLAGMTSYACAISALNSFKRQVEEVQKRARAAYDPRRVR